jgi:hypothetical protein
MGNYPIPYPLSCSAVYVGEQRRARNAILYSLILAINHPFIALRDYQGLDLFGSIDRDTD